MTNLDLKPEQAALLTQALNQGDDALFATTLAELTPYQAAQYEASTNAHSDFTYKVWCTSTTWGFEIMWAGFLLMTPEEIEQQKQEMRDEYNAHPHNLYGKTLDEYIDDFFSIPANFDPHIPLENISLWAIGDHLTRIKK